MEQAINFGIPQKIINKQKQLIAWEKIFANTTLNNRRA